MSGWVSTLSWVQPTAPQGLILKLRHISSEIWKPSYDLFGRYSSDGRSQFQNSFSSEDSILRVHFSIFTSNGLIGLLQPQETSSAGDLNASTEITGQTTYLPFVVVNWSLDSSRPAALRCSFFFFFKIIFRYFFLYRKCRSFPLPLPGGYSTIRPTSKSICSFLNSYPSLRHVIISFKIQNKSHD